MSWREKILPSTYASDQSSQGYQFLNTAAQPSNNNSYFNQYINSDKNMSRNLSSTTLRNPASYYQFSPGVQSSKYRNQDKIGKEIGYTKAPIKEEVPKLTFKDNMPKIRRRLNNDEIQNQNNEDKGFNRFPSFKLNVKLNEDSSLNKNSNATKPLEKTNFSEFPKFQLNLAMPPSKLSSIPPPKKLGIQQISKVRSEANLNYKNLQEEKPLWGEKKFNPQFYEKGIETSSNFLAFPTKQEAKVVNSRSNTGNNFTLELISSQSKIEQPSKKKQPFYLTHSFPYQRMAPQQDKAKLLKKSDFQIGKTLGKGQYGQVLVVRHKKTGFVCAMKVMSKKVIKQQNYENQIVRQMSIQFYLSHRNIAPLYGYFYDEENIYLLVQFCQGGHLYSKIKKEKKLQQRQTSRVIKQVLQGLDYMHRLQIIHRDLKPENILFTYNVIKISDFGWAVFDNDGFRKTMSGSPLYYPPQIVKGQQYDEKIDLWNVGMMAYECLLGKIPFRIYSELDLNKIVSDEITFPEYVDVSQVAKDFILKSMRKNADDRMQIREMLRHKFIKQYDQKQKIEGLQQCFNRLMSY